MGVEPDRVEASSARRPHSARTGITLRGRPRHPGEQTAREKCYGGADREPSIVMSIFGTSRHTYRSSKRAKALAGVTALAAAAAGLLLASPWESAGAAVAPAKPAVAAAAGAAAMWSTQLQAAPPRRPAAHCPRTSS